MNMKNHISILSAAALLLLVTQARAATVDYILDQANSLADGIDYLAVSISDDTPDQLDFQVETLPVLGSKAGSNYGIQSFAFNFSTLIADLSTVEFLLPEGWRLQYNKGMSEAGRFDVRIMGTGSSRLDPLLFSITAENISLEAVAAGFAAHVAGFMALDGHPGVSSAFIYGDRLVPPAAIPLPAAVWLFGSGLLGLAGVARRRRH